VLYAHCDLPLQNSPTVGGLKPKHPLRFEILARFNKARVSRLHLPHGVVDTPVFM